MTKLEGGLALAAGGARGAYQVGVLRAFAERGLRFTHVAGTSIGALNGAFYAQSDGSPAAIAALAELWRAFPSAGLIRVKATALLGHLALAELLGPSAMKILTLLGRSGMELLDPSGLEMLLDSAIDYERLRRSPTRLTVCALPATGPLADVLLGPFTRAAYLDAHACTAAELRSLLLASAAIPLAFPAREVRGTRYSDAALSDPLPAAELHRRGHRRIYSIFLADSTVQDRAEIPGALLFQVRPSVPIDGPLFSCFDFSAATLERLMALGYEDGRRALDEVNELERSIDDLVRSGDIEEGLARSLPDRRRRR